jgi:hypothetical protein
MASRPRKSYRPGRRSEELELILSLSLRDSVGRDQAVLVAHHGVLHAADWELGEAVDAQTFEESLRIGSLKGEESRGGQPCMDVAALPPGHAVVLQAPELPGPDRWDAGKFDGVIQHMVFVKGIAEGELKVGLSSHVCSFESSLLLMPKIAAAVRRSASCSSSNSSFTKGTARPSALIDSRELVPNWSLWGLEKTGSKPKTVDFIGAP